MTTDNMVEVGEVTRYGKNSAGKQWHGINWSNGVDIPEGTKVYIKEEELGQKVEITDGPASGKTGVIINTGVHNDLRYYVVGIDGYDSSFTLVCNGEFNFI
jgi:hypothetical protein